MYVWHDIYEIQDAYFLSFKKFQRICSKHVALNRWYDSIDYAVFYVDA